MEITANLPWVLTDLDCTHPLYKMTHDLPETYMSSIGFNWPQARFPMIRDVIYLLFKELLCHTVTLLQYNSNYAVKLQLLRDNDKKKFRHVQYRHFRHSYFLSEVG